ncbi:MAG TPA: pyridoxamine 5'-phosphate oxidase family protein [Ktedonobacterales bacterium]
MDTPPAESSEPVASRPRMYGGHLEPTRLPWKWAVAQLVAARNYWIATTRPNGQPHTRPVWGVWLNDVLYFSTGALTWKNLEQNSATTVHLESASKVVILEGATAAISDPALAAQIATAYEAKDHWKLDANDLPYAFRPQIGFGWLSDDEGLDGGSAFRGTATRWTFP